NRRALELATERYTGGLENFISVLDAQRSVYAAEDQLVQSETNVAVTLVAVYKSLGGGWSADGNERSAGLEAPVEGGPDCQSGRPSKPSDRKPRTGACGLPARGSR